MKLTDIYEEWVKLIEAGKGNYKYVNHRGMVAEEVHKVVVDDDKREVTII